MISLKIIFQNEVRRNSKNKISDKDFFFPNYHGHQLPRALKTSQDFGIMPPIIAVTAQSCKSKLTHCF